VVSLAAAVDEIDASAPAPDVLVPAVDRGLFRPDEEAALLAWFARFLTVRTALWEVLGEVSRPVGGSVRRILDLDGWRVFVLGYTAACLIVRLDRMLLDDIAAHSVTQRKLNEGSAAHRIPRKQYTAVLESFSDPVKARAMDQAMRFAAGHRRQLDALADDPVVGGLAAGLTQREAVLDQSKRRYLSRLATYLGHAIRRRGASARQQSVFAALEAGGRLASELRDHWAACRINDDLRRRLGEMLQPGDVLITRHDHAFTNLFLPGYWPHAALYVGSDGDRERMGVPLDAERAARWRGDRRVLEALKDGVLFRPIEQTLAVDAVAVIRPQLGRDELVRGLGRAVEHEGKSYDFDFDFFRSDCLVCTEVIYRAFDGLGQVRIPLTERSGRPTVSAEDLLDLAVAGRGFDPVAVCGAPDCPDRILEGEAARDVMRRRN
jgi:hypothetical protein